MSIFEKLAGNISRDERERILDKIRATTDEFSSPILLEGISESGIDIEAEWIKLPIVDRFFLWLQSLFSQISREELLENRFLNHRARNVDKRFPGVLYYKDGNYGPSLGRRILRLQKAFSVFASPLRTLGDDNLRRQEFYALFFSLELPEIHDRLQSELMPEELTEEDEDTSDLIQKGLKKLEDILDEISAEERKKLYDHARSLAVLRKLSFFPFSKILSAYIGSLEADGARLPMNKVIGTLKELADVLNSMPYFPDLGLIQALFLFQRKKEEEEGKTFTEDIVGPMLTKARAAQDALSDFNKMIPLIELVRLASGHLDYEPDEVSGGEDWFTHFREFYRTKLERSVGEFLKRQRKVFLLRRALETVRIGELPSSTLDPANSLFERLGTPEFHFTFRILKAYVTGFFQTKVLGPVKTILIDGDFYKPQNRQDFTESFNGLTKAWDAMKQIESDLALGGAVEKDLENVNQELSSPLAKTKRVQLLRNSISKRAQDAVQDFLASMGSFLEVLHGIRFGESGGRYDTLSNYSYIGGGENKRFKENLGLIEDNSHSFFMLASEMYDLELDAD